MRFSHIICVEVIVLNRIPYQQDYLCGDCAHYRPHYVKTGDRYFPIHQGHCVFPRTKPRREDEHCPHWAPSPDLSPEKDRNSP